MVRRPLENLDGLKPLPGLVGMVAALLGSTAYDGFSNSSAWIGWAQNQDVSMTWLGTAALIVFILFVLVTFSGATLLAGRLSDSSRTTLPRLFAHSVIPIAFGYVVAHYLTLFILEGQRTLIYLSDPLSNGANIFGTGLLAVNTGITNHSTTIAVIQVLAVVCGHLLGVVSAHDRAVALFPRNKALIVVDAERHPGVAAQRLALRGGSAGVEHDHVAVEHEPDRGDVGPPVGAHRRELGGAGALHQEVPPLVVAHRSTHGQRLRRRCGGGGSGIRTHGELPHTRFPSVPIRPLSHPSRGR